MAKTANLNVRMDPIIKSRAEELFSALGITITDAINLFIYQALDEDGLPFQCKRNRKTYAAMQEALDIEAGRIPSKAYRCAKELSEELDLEC